MKNYFLCRKWAITHIFENNKEDIAVYVKQHPDEAIKYMPELID